MPRPWRALTGHGSPRPRAIASQASGSRWDESTLLTTTRTGRPVRLSMRATARSSSTMPDGDVHHQQDDVCLGDGPFGLGTHLGVERVFAGQPSARCRPR